MKKDNLKWAALVACLLLVSNIVNAQYEYKPFRVDLGAGMSFLMGENDNFGIGGLMSVEPSYSVKRFTFGTRFECNMMAQLYDDWNDQGNVDMLYSFAFLATADYHFTSGTFRPFVGAGLGFYVLSASRDTYFYNSGYNNREYYFDYSDAEWVDYGANFGGIIRGGFDVNHFRLSLTFNLINKPSDYSTRYIGDRVIYNHSREFSYVALTFSGYIGGGKVR